MSDDGKIKLSHVEMGAYAHLFGFVEEFIAPKMERLALDFEVDTRDAFDALANFASEEVKHIRQCHADGGHCTLGRHAAPASLHSLSAAVRCSLLAPGNGRARHEYDAPKRELILARTLRGLATEIALVDQPIRQQLAGVAATADGCHDVLRTVVHVGHR